MYKYHPDKEIERYQPLGNLHGAPSQPLPNPHLEETIILTSNLLLNFLLSHTVCV